MLLSVYYSPPLISNALLPFSRDSSTILHHIQLAERVRVCLCLYALMTAWRRQHLAA